MSKILRTLVPVVVLAVVATACGSGGTTATEATTVPTEATTVTTEPTTTTTEATTTTTEAVDTSALAAQVEELMAVTARIRRLEFLSEPTITALSVADLKERLRREVEEDLADEAEELEQDKRLFALFGMLDPDIDLAKLYTDYTVCSAIAWYDDETKEIVIPARRATLNLAEQSILVHELTHALQDQHFDLNTWWNTLQDEERWEEFAAYRAVVEGDARLTEDTFVGRFNVDERQQYNLELGSLASCEWKGPQFLLVGDTFAYSRGAELMRALRDEGDDVRNRAFIDRPDTTEQALHPEKYLRDEQPLPVELPDLAVDGYELVDDGIWGELDFHTMFTTTLGGGPAIEAAEGWGGGQFRIYDDGDDLLVVIVYRGDTRGDAEEVEAAWQAFVPEVMETDDGRSDGSGTVYEGAERWAFVSRSGDTVVVIAATDAAAGEAARGAFSGF